MTPGVQERHSFQQSLTAPKVTHPGAAADCSLPHPGYACESSHRYKIAAWLPWTVHEGSLADCELPHPQCSPEWTAEKDTAWLAGGYSARTS